MPRREQKSNDANDAFNPEDKAPPPTRPRRAEFLSPLPRGRVLGQPERKGEERTDEERKDEKSDSKPSRPF